MSPLFAWVLDTDAFSPHGLCLAWVPGLLAMHALSDAAMALCYVAVGGLIFTFGRKRPDMGPAAVFNTLSLVFAMCGLTHFSDVVVLWTPYYTEQGVFKAISALASVAMLFVLLRLMPQAMRVPSAAQLEDVNSRLREEVQASRRQQHHMRKLSMVVEQNPAMVLITDLNGTIEYANAAFSALSGYRADEVIGRTPAMLRSERTPSAMHVALWESLASGAEWRGELEDLRKDGSVFWVSATISPVRDDTGAVSHFVAIEQDITTRKQAELQIIEARHQAEMANKAKSELLANMSHELRTPLNAIIGFSGAMQIELFGGLGHDKYREYAADIRNSGEHLLALINDILDVSAVEAGQLRLAEEDVAMDEVIEGCLRLIRPRAELGNVSLHAPAGPVPRLRADGRRIKQVVLNLLSNAVKFTPEGGTVRVDVARDPSGDLAIIVADTGIGMGAEDIAKAVQPFGQVDSSLQRKYEGTGLGLPLTIGLVDKHGGRLEIASTPHQGTVVTVHLPAWRVLPDAAVAGAGCPAVGGVCGA